MDLENLGRLPESSSGPLVVEEAIESKMSLENSLAIKAKTSLRLKYEAEAQVILKKLGGLNGIQLELGLSQRKICQLLLVDPSSWSRWLQDEAKTPPHILRALEWHMALMEKYPGFDINFWLHSTAKSTSLAFEKSQKLEEDLLKQTLELKNRIQDLETQIASLNQGQETNYNKSNAVLKKNFAMSPKSSSIRLGLFCFLTLLLVVASLVYLLK